MNCQMFSELASDVARDQMMDAAARAQALAHANSCVSCADRLNAQQQLTSDLRELVSAMGDQTASTAVWENLSAAFDTRSAAPIPTYRRRSVYVAGAIAAMLVIAFGLVQFVRHSQSPEVEATIAATFTSSPAQTTTESKEKDPIVRSTQKRQPTPNRHFATRPALTSQVNQPKEITTDFILLTYDGEVGSDAQMVRMELPRSAMANFGLPVNMDRADQRVKADVLVGADGLARAIRFVQ